MSGSATPDRDNLAYALPEGRILAGQLTAVRRIGVGAAVALPRISRRVHAAHSERLVVEDVVEIAQAEAVVRPVGVHVVDVRHVQAEAQVVIGRGLLVVVEGGLRGLKNLE